jgi:hypothetical protein
MTDQYSVSYNGSTGQYSVFLGEKKITAKDSEPDAWRYIQAIEARKFAGNEPHRQSHRK